MAALCRVAPFDHDCKSSEEMAPPIPMLDGLRLGKATVNDLDCRASGVELKTDLQRARAWRQ